MHKILVGHVLDRLRELPENSVQCVFTSPPYWGLRSYGTSQQAWPGAYYGLGLPECYRKSDPSAHLWRTGTDYCYLCNAWRGELGHEPSVLLYIDHLVSVFREIRRVLHPRGIAFLNLGDCYATNPGNGRHGASNKSTLTGSNPVLNGTDREYQKSGLKRKDLVGIPWRAAFALQQDGWWLRSDIIWQKNNPLPESVTDRPTRSHEYIFLLAKSWRYFYDAEASSEPVTTTTTTTTTRLSQESFDDQHGGEKDYRNNDVNANRSFRKTLENLKANFTGKRNRRTVQTLPTAMSKVEHFATFPEDLVEPWLRSGAPADGVCAQCRMPRWKKRHLVRKEVNQHMIDCGASKDGTYLGESTREYTKALAQNPSDTKRSILDSLSKVYEYEWVKVCDCATNETVPAIILDPFSGSATTGVVAEKLGFNYIGIELNQKYADDSMARLGEFAPLFTNGGTF